MSWPIKFRAISFAVTMGVTIMESLVAAIPVALALWYFDVASTARIFESLALFAATFSLSISIYSHLRPTPFRRSTSTRGAA